MLLYIKKSIICNIYKHIIIVSNSFRKQDRCNQHSPFLFIKLYKLNRKNAGTFQFSKLINNYYNCCLREKYLKYDLRCIKNIIRSMLEQFLWTFKNVLRFFFFYFIKYIVERANEEFN